MNTLGWQAWYTLAVVVLMVAGLVREWGRPAMVLLCALGAVLVAGVVPPEAGLAGFSNSAVLTVGALYVVAAGIQQSGALAFFGGLLGERGRSLPGTLARLMGASAFFSGLLNNTPVVAMLIPRVQAWGERRGVSPSKLLLPLSYASIVGGMTTLIGTSTNLVVSGLLEGHGHAPLGLFELAPVGLPVAAAVLAYFVVLGHRLLPEREGEALPAGGDGVDEFLFDLNVAREGNSRDGGTALLARRATLAGQTVEEAGLRELGDAYLVHLERDGRLMQASPEQVLQEGDTLTFTGRLSMFDELLARPGLERLVPTLGEHDSQTLPLYEAVVADSSRLVGKTLREADFREHYQGVVLGIQRKNERIEGPLGRTPLEPGDLLIVEAQSGFDERFGPGRGEFYLAAPRREGRRRRASGRALVAGGLLVGMIGINVAGLVPLVVAAFAAALGMVLTGCLSLQEAGEAVSLPVLIVIASALGLGQAIEATGLAGVFAHGLVGVAAGGGLLAVLAAVYIATNVLTELITNNAAAVLMLPVALATAADLDASPRAFAIVVAVAASASFLTPLGYHTNLMVMSPGGYRVRDYLRAGWPVSLLVMGVTLAAVGGFWL